MVFRRTQRPIAHPVSAGAIVPESEKSLRGADLDGAQVYSSVQVEEFARLYLDGAGRERLDPILDSCVAVYKNNLDEDTQVDFKGKVKGFVRNYSFLSSILPWTNRAWELRSIFPNFLIPKLPAPRDEDLSRGIFDSIDMESYRVEQLIARTLLEGVAANEVYRNTQRNSDAENTRVECDKAQQRVMNSIIRNDNQLFKHFMDNDGFRRWVTDATFELAAKEANPS